MLLSEGVKNGSATELSSGVAGCGCAAKPEESMIEPEASGADWGGAAKSPEDAGAGAGIETEAAGDSAAEHEQSKRAQMRTREHTSIDFFIVNLQLICYKCINIILRIY